MIFHRFFNEFSSHLCHSGVTSAKFWVPAVIAAGVGNPPAPSSGGSPGRVQDRMCQFWQELAFHRATRHPACPAFHHDLARLTRTSAPKRGPRAVAKILERSPRGLHGPEKVPKRGPGAPKDREKVARIRFCFERCPGMAKQAPKNVPKPSRRDPSSSKSLVLQW